MFARFHFQPKKTIGNVGRITNIVDMSLGCLFEEGEGGMSSKEGEGGRVPQCSLRISLSAHIMALACL